MGVDRFEGQLFLIRHGATPLSWDRTPALTPCLGYEAGRGELSSWTAGPFSNRRTLPEISESAVKHYKREENCVSSPPSRRCNLQRRSSGGLLRFEPGSTGRSAAWRPARRPAAGRG